jgi:hypothetical protein
VSRVTPRPSISRYRVVDVHDLDQGLALSSRRSSVSSLDDSLASMGSVSSPGVPSAAGAAMPRGGDEDAEVGAGPL